MPASSDSVDLLKLKLKSAIKLKLSREKMGNVFRNLERSYLEDLKTTKEEINFETEQLKHSKTQIADVYHQITLIEVCKSSENSKVNAHICNLNHHKKGFENLFIKAQVTLQVQQKTQQDKVDQKLEAKKQKLLLINKLNEQRMHEAVAVESECDSLERECSVLKKRNVAIMLKLRRKLLETEDLRRELLKVKEASSKNNGSSQAS